MKILVTGGCGYIGSHTLIDLIKNGYEVVSLDNNMRSNPDILKAVEDITGKSVTNLNIDLTDKNKLFAALKMLYDVNGIIHFAALKSVPESVEKPILYYRNNMVSLYNLLEAAETFNIPNFVFSSSCSVYGNVEELPVTERTPFGNAESPYAATKQMGEKVIRDFANKTASLNFILLRYFNPVGAHESGKIGEVPFDTPNNLVPRITGTAIGKYDKLTVFGGELPTRDGSCIRDYIHVMDIANAHTKAIDYLKNNKQIDNCEIFNLGTGNGVSVFEAIQAFEKTSNTKLNYEVGKPRDGDIISVYADNNLAKEKLDWTAKRSIDNMMASAWKWELNMKEGKTFLG